MNKISHLTFKLFMTVICVSTIIVCTLSILNDEKLEEVKFNEVWNDMVDASNTDSIAHPDWYRMTTAGVNHADSLAFEYLAERATVVDLPEESPMTGDSMCAYVRNDTIFIEYYNMNRFPGFEYQRSMFKFLYNK